jgi:hypothetical protein
MTATLETARLALEAAAKATAAALDLVVALQAKPIELVDLADIGVSKRATYRAACAGEIEGAIKIERRWYAAPDAVRAWVDSHRPRKVVPPPVKDSARAVADSIARELGLRRIA